MEARVGIEPTHKGFADLSLTTWVPRLTYTIHSRAQDTNCLVGVYRKSEGVWSGRPGSNRRHLPWQGSTLPLSYSRPAFKEYSENTVSKQRGNSLPFIAAALCYTSLNLHDIQGFTTFAAYLASAAQLPARSHISQRADPSAGCNPQSDSIQDPP